MTIKQLNSLAILTTLLLTFLARPVQAGQPIVWETSGRTELLKGDARGVSISDTGVLMLAPGSGAVFWAILVGAGTATFPLILVLVGLRARTTEGTAALS